MLLRLMPARRNITRIQVQPPSRIITDIGAEVAEVHDALWSDEV